MKKILRRRFFGPQSDNRKSKTCAEQRRSIQNLKWVGIFQSLLTCALGGAVAKAQQPAKLFRIGFLDSSTASGSAVLLEAFRQEMSKLGWIEGKNIAIEYRFAEEKNERLSELAADLVRLKVDLIVVAGTVAAVSGEERHHDHPHRDGERRGPRRCRSGCQSGAAGRKCHRALGFSARAKYAKGWRYSKTRSPSSPELDFCGRRAAIDSPTERAQACGSGTEAKIGGDRHSTRPQRFRERLSNRQAKAGRRNYDDDRSPLFRRKKADRRACRQIPLACNLLPEGVC